MLWPRAKLAAAFQLPRYHVPLMGHVVSGGQSGTDVSYVSDCYAFACYISLAPIRKGPHPLIGKFCSI